MALLGGACSSAMRVERASGLGKTPYKRIIVAAGIDHLEMRTIAEDAFAMERAAEADIVPSVQILQAGRGYEPDEMSRTISGSGADAVAIVNVSGAGRDSVRFPSFTAGNVCTMWVGRVCRQRVASAAVVSDTRPWLAFDIELYEMGTGRMMWKAEVRTGGRNREGAEAILRRLAHDVVAAWEKDGVVVRPVPPSAR
jgi:hypothetical protein